MWRELATKECNQTVLLIEDDSIYVPLASVSMTNERSKLGNRRTGMLVIIFFISTNVDSASWVHLNLSLHKSEVNDMASLA